MTENFEIVVKYLTLTGLSRRWVGPLVLSKKFCNLVNYFLVKILIWRLSCIRIGQLSAFPHKYLFYSFSTLFSPFFRSLIFFWRFCPFFEFFRFLFEIFKIWKRYFLKIIRRFVFLCTIYRFFYLEVLL